MQSLNPATPSNQRALPYSRSFSACAGYTLVEIMITSMIMLLTLTGMITMQLVSIKAVQSTYQRTQAVTLAYQMSDCLRANRGDSTNAPTALGGNYDSHTLCHANRRHPYDRQTCAYDEFSDIAANVALGAAARLDLQDWWSALDTSGLPNWYARIDRINSDLIDGPPI